MRTRTRRIAYVLAVFAGLAAAPAGATYSIIACDHQGDCGAAVATHNLAVGASVIYAQAKVGALATQFETNPHYGPKALALLAKGTSPGKTINALLAQDGNFDGSGIDERQLIVIDADGNGAVYTGTKAAAGVWGAQTSQGAGPGDSCSVAGNGLASEAVLNAMVETFRGADRKRPLGDRLMASLRAGERAGGQRNGRMSAALRVSTVAGDWQDIDLRVDGSADPVGDLSRLTDQFYAHQAMLRAERAARDNDVEAARAARSQALGLSHQWDRIWRRAARLAMQLGESDKALEYLGVFASINPVWAEGEIEDALYAPLQAQPAFARLRADIASKVPGG
ncbi:DUF1028 domain-containing protein [Lysobacter capsici]|uniref:DUF1028 domain-containing protein n=1 Tax=Lysobacter capsici TaxID=435897 RepID=UPI001C00187C|nr:DUF1028 domain-containing protein [Lysobacter capsici]QWF17437.1 DUF1028 domain-containing protein [Lysobacter capsici]